MTEKKHQTVREQVPFWLEHETVQNFGDSLSGYFMERLFLHVPRLPGDIRIVGSCLLDALIIPAIERNEATDLPTRAPLLAWGAGIREPGSLSAEIQNQIEILSVRGPDSASVLGLGASVPLGDPGLLLPALYQPSSESDALKGKRVCIPHFHDRRSDAEILELTGADAVLRASIKPGGEAIENFIDDMLSADLVLCGSLHGAIAAAAYGKPFAFWDSGRIDLPFKWKDFADSINIPCEFVAEVQAAEKLYKTKIAPSIQLPSMWPMLAVAPFPIRPDVLINLLERDLSRSGSASAERLHQIRISFEKKRAYQEAIAEDASLLVDALSEKYLTVVESIEEKEERLREILQKETEYQEKIERISAELQSSEENAADLTRAHQHEISSLHEVNRKSIASAASSEAYINQLSSRLFKAYRKPFKPLKYAFLRVLLKGILAFKPVLSKKRVRKLEASLLKRKPSHILNSALQESAQIASEQRANSALWSGGATGDPRGAFELLSVAVPIHFDTAPNPDVSIIIPSYKDEALLTSCLKSISATAKGAASFEVIVIDDCPDQRSNYGLPASEGLKQINNEENLGFLRSCNKAAKSARGRIICLLNSDVIVTSGWLDALVEALDSDDDIGIAGGMLIEKDGTVQDAGWRILNNGWGEKIGTGQSPRSGALSYRRDVDCVTGACMAIKRSVWEQLGGFDEAFAPAFYEEFDFCIRARSLGIRTVYEPLCKIFHLGSSSYGGKERDRLSLEHHATFIKHHAGFLADQPERLGRGWLDNAANSNQPLLLFIDFQIPDPRRHAGDVTTLSYVMLLKELGFQIVYFADDRNTDGPMVDSLEQSGVAFIRGPETLEGWLQDNGKDVKRVWIARPEIADRYMDLLKKYTDAKISYYTHDLHYLRMEREAEMKQDPELKSAARKMRKLEYRVFDAVDFILTPSRDEETIISKNCRTDVQAIPPYFFESEDVTPRSIESFEHTKDIAFVGGFPHVPNVDAALLLANTIMPIVWESHPEARLLLVGYRPPQEIQDLANDRIVVTGQVAEIKPWLDRSRLMAAPLRYGAGVKGKIVEAMRAGLPVVTTAIGIEGIGATTGQDALIEETPQAIADAIIALLDSPERCAIMSMSAASLIKQRFSKTSAAEIMRIVMPEIGKASFYDYPEEERISLTDKAIAEKGTIQGRWAVLADSETEGARPWSERARITAEYLLPAHSVTDYGCGTMVLERHLQPNQQYVPVDVVARDERTIVCDFNTQQPPKTKTDAASCLGLLEYIHDVAGFVSHVAANHPLCVISYNTTDAPEPLEPRKGHGWVNAFSAGEFEELLKANGFEIKDRQLIDSHQYLWLVAGADADSN